MVKLYNGDCMDVLRKLSDKSVDLVLTDPPYNIRKAEWDKVDHYVEWCMEWIRECERVLTDTGSFYFWHNDMPQATELMQGIQRNTELQFQQMCVWVKPSFRKMAWNNPTKKNTLRNWFNICEYLFYYVKGFGGLMLQGGSESTAIRNATVR